MARLMRVDCIWIEGKDGFFLEAAPAAFGEKAVFLMDLNPLGGKKPTQNAQNSVRQSKKEVVVSRLNSGISRGRKAA